ncbi:methionyl-tRNA formyltransferase [Piscinibacter koreensis]|uniref:Methionyl-tRNA formyltransferase n=1 Tax=Piscinibacter koreensis TaxID=2742824 RepID=A0A7Y6TWW3_9BURK|nr:methionyl-tRNA formyltransferase [Schlegelella koreensis]NUZ06437.1 methionyl-tRNA formyltransferase [Schlegelella koreensis]
MRVAFAGTPEFAERALAAIHAAGHKVPLVLTQPDRPAGRGLKLQPSPVKAFALAHDIAVAQPRSLRLDGRFTDDAEAAREALEAAAADVMVVAAYGLILPEWVLAQPRHGCINIHASLLPRWRGAAPVQRAIEAGDAETGISIMQMDRGLDTGDVLLVEALPIGAGDTAGTLTERLADRGGRLVVDALARLDAGDVMRTPQPQAGVTYASKVLKSEAPIDWRQPAVRIERRIRAFDPFPGASGVLGGETVKCWRAECVAGSGAPGEVIGVQADGLVVACGEGALRLTELQRPAGRRLPAAAFLQRGSVRIGDRFALPDAVAADEPFPG